MPSPIPSPSELQKAYANSGKSVHRACLAFGVCGETFRKWMLRQSLATTGSHWTPEEDAKLRDLYGQMAANRWSLTHVARLMGRSRSAIAHRANRLRITDPTRTKAWQTKAEQLEIPWARWVKHEHPRGYLGRKHGTRTKAILAEKSKAAWDRMRESGTGNMSEARRQEMSDRMLELRKKLKTDGQQPFSRCRGGKRADLGNRYFRSRWEANIARYLNFLIKHGELHKWEYEPDTFWFHKIKRGTRSYTPDFKVWDRKDSDPYYIEVKGWMTKQSKTRMDRMKRYYPDVRIDMIGQSRYREIMRTAKALIPEWEGSK